MAIKEPEANPEAITSRFEHGFEIPPVRILGFQRIPNPDGEPTLQYQVQFRKENPAPGEPVEIKTLSWEEAAISIGLPESMYAKEV